jgi:GNAT superfamily N-acetyltransferase
MSDTAMTSSSENLSTGDRSPANLAIRNLEQSDFDTISNAFTAIGWNKPASQYQRYFEEQIQGERVIFVAEIMDESDPSSPGSFAGYITVVWNSPYPPFSERNIPEIKDLNVLPDFRRRGIGASLLDVAEKTIRTRSTIAGIGVGLYPGYGAAQRIYARRGYVPDGRGIYDGDTWVKPGTQVRVDDSLTLQMEKKFDA